MVVFLAYFSRLLDFSTEKNIYPGISSIMQLPDFPKQCSLFLFVLFFYVTKDLKNSWQIHCSFNGFFQGHMTITKGQFRGSSQLPVLISSYTKECFKTSQLITFVVNESTCCFDWVGLLFKHGASVIYEKKKQLFSAKIINQFVIKMKAYQSLFFVVTTNNIGYWERGEETQLTTWLRTNQGLSILTLQFVRWTQA